MVAKTLQSLETQSNGAFTKHCSIHKKNTHTTLKTSRPPPLKMKAASIYFPKDDKKGEDAHFICPDKNAIGVADGVGGWARKGIDAGKYARRLMANSLTVLQHKSTGLINPAEVLHDAFNNTLEKGSSTACIIALNGKFLDYANVGDSELMVFRERKMIYRSPVQQRGSNNCPNQLGASKSGPSSADEHSLIVKGGDVVVAGTDGLFDNMFASEIEEALGGNQDAEAEELASVIAELALFNALDDEYYSPYQQAAEVAGRKHRGGKFDDITVLVAKIVQ